MGSQIRSHSRMKSSSPRARLPKRVLDVPPRLLLLVFCALLCTLLSLWMGAQPWSWVRTVDGVALDNYFKARGAVDNKSVAQMPHTRDIVLIETKHALPRQLYARLLDQLHLARVVAFDTMFLDNEAQLHADELTPEEKQNWYGKAIEDWRRDNAILATAIRKNGRVVLGTWPEESLDRDVADATTATSSTRSIRSDGARGTTWRQPPQLLWKAARYHAHVLVEPDEQDSVCRTVRLRDGEPFVPALGLALAAASLQISPQQLEREVRAMKVDGGVLQLGSQRVAYGRNGEIVIDFVGGRNAFESGNRVVYQRVLDGTYLPEDFKDKIVIIGEASATSKEILPTPFGAMPGMQIHANIAATLLSAVGAPQPLNRFFVGLISWFSCLMLLAPLSRYSLWTSFVLALLSAAAMFLLGSWLFASRNLILPLSVPLLAMFLTLNVLALAEYARVRSTLGTFIGHDLVPQTVGLWARLRLGGRTEEATAWFCDLRGFSAISEGRTPEAISDFLARYTNLLVEVVQKYGGRPIDYQGDGVFVLFEKRVAGEHFALQAVAASVELRERMNVLRATLQSEGLATGEISIGIATGPIMIGVVGARHHMKMGAVGDTVNIASRVQNLSGRCGQTILLTKSTWEKVSSEYETRFCGIYPVRGRVEPLPIYAVLGAQKNDAPETPCAKFKWRFKRRSSTRSSLRT